MRGFAALACTLAALVAIGPAAPGMAQEMSPTARTKAMAAIEASLLDKERRTAAQRKMSSELLDRILEDPRGEVEVDLRANVTPELLARIGELGGQLVSAFPGYRAIRAVLPASALEELAESDDVQTLAVAERGVSNQRAPTSGHDGGNEAGELPDPPESPRSRSLVGASVRLKDNTSEGDIAHQADLARQTHGVDGTGIGIGVISNGVRTLASRQATGDLPAHISILPGQAGAGDEGTAMLEIVHDLAPGADLYFASGNSGKAQMAANIEAVCAAGADIIVDDLQYSDDSAFQDGLISRAISSVVGQGCLYFSAAGNGGNLNDGTSGVWEGDYVQGDPLTVGGETVGNMHDFGGGVHENRVEKDTHRWFTLQWSDPWGAAANDYDLFLVDAEGDVIASSTTTQDGSQDPFEGISSGADHTGASLIVVKVSGSGRYLRLFSHTGELAIATAGATYGHQAAEDAIGVAAVQATEAAFDGSESVQTHSSDGPRRIFYTADGEAVTAGDFSSTGGRLLNKPDLAAADGVSTATPGFDPFEGTSAAAPHAAAIAALMLEARGGPSGFTPALARTAMAQGAHDIEATGVDRDAGTGLVMAPGAVGAVAVAIADRNGAPTVENAIADQTLVPGGDAATFDLDTVFDDPDDDDLTWRVDADDPVRVEAVIDEMTGTLTLTPNSPGRTAVVVQATDPDGLSATLVFEVTLALGNKDYDTDNDGLIDVADLAQLDAMRYDLNGDGAVDGTDWSTHAAAFPQAALGMGCPDVCSGFELTGNLDFDTNGNGMADAGDSYWNNGAGWTPIGLFPDEFTATFEGNGKTISNLYIDAAVSRAALFDSTDTPGAVRNLGLVDVDIDGGSVSGALVGYNKVTITSSYATGTVTATSVVGGLVGQSFRGAIERSYANVDVTGTGNHVGGLVGLSAGVVEESYATGNVSSTGSGVGGLVGVAENTIHNSFAAGDVSGEDAVGGLAGETEWVLSCYATGRVSGRGGRQEVTRYTPWGGVGGLSGNATDWIRNSYATGPVSGEAAVGGLVGTIGEEHRIYSSYWDRTTSGLHVGVGSDDVNDNGLLDGSESVTGGVAGHGTGDLQSPTGASGPYENWDREVFRSVAPDAWDFGTGSQYPALSVDMDGNDTATWQEFGRQLRDTPAPLTATTSSGSADAVLGWQAVTGSHWSPQPGLTYSVTRKDATAQEAPQTVASGLTGTGYTDSGVSGTTYAYQAQAQADGGTVTRSARVTVISGAANRPPAAVGTLPDLSLRAGADATTVDVDDAFEDPDGDTLTFAAASDGAAVTATVSGSVISLTPVSAGSALVTVSATDAAGSNTSARQRFRVTVWSASAVDYDEDDDGLIEIASHQQLDAVRYDLDGDGIPEATEATSYASAFPDAIGLMGCPNIDGCSGYELTVDLDLDTNGNGTADAGDAYWNGGLGWNPIGGEGSTASGGITYLRNPFDTVFEGNGHRVSNLYVRSETDPLLAGLFGYAGRGSLIRNLAVVDADVAGLRHVGTLVGTTDGSVTGVYATGRVEGTGAYAFAGGLAGQKLSNSLVSVSYASVSVEGTANAAGGLVGLNFGEIEASYATGAVVGTKVGALVGRNAGTIVASYATGALPGINTGYLVRERFLRGTTSNSYFDTQTAGVAFRDSTGQTTSSLQSPTDYSGIYSTWNVDTDGDGSADDPWDFGGSGDYPALNHDFDGGGAATWEEFGYQLRDGPTLTIATGSGQPVLTWTAVAADDWDPEPSVLYTVTRNDGTDVNTLASGLAALTYTDGDVIEGETYSYQVAAGTGAGEAVRSSVVEVTTPIDPTTPPRVRSIASDATHPTKDAFTVTIGFTKAVTGLEASEIEVDNGSASNFSGSGATYRLRVTPDADFEGDVTVRVPAGVAVDGASNLNEVGSESFAADTRAPALAASDGATANGATLTLTYDETLAAVTTPASAFTVTGATSRSVTAVSVSGEQVQLTVSPPILHGESGIEVDYAVPSLESLEDAVGNRAASFTDQAVANETPATTLSSTVNLLLDTPLVQEGDSAKSVTVTGALNRSARPAATTVAVEVGASGDTATEGSDYATVGTLTLTIPAYTRSATVRFMLTPANDRIDEPNESLTVSGSTTAGGLSVSPPGGLTIGIADDDAAPSLGLSVNRTTIAEDGGTASVTVSTGTGSTFEAAQTVLLSVTGTATETADYTFGATALTLPAGTGSNASTVSTTLTGVDDTIDDDDETIVISASHDGRDLGQRHTVTIDDDDDPEVTVSFRQSAYRVAEGAHVDVAVTLSAVPERAVTIPIEAEGADGAESIDYSVTPANLRFGANETAGTVRVSAANDSVVDPGEGVSLGFGTLPDRVSAGTRDAAAVAIRDEDFTFVPTFAAGAGATESSATDIFVVDEDEGALRLNLALVTPGGVKTVDVAAPVVVSLATLENAGSREAGEDHAAERQSGTFGDYGRLNRDISFAPGDFLDDGTCGCARAEKAVSVDVFNDRVHEATEVFVLRLTRDSGRLSVSSKDLTVKIAEDDAVPVLSLDVDPIQIAEAGGTATVTVDTGSGSTFPTTHTISLDLSGTATQNVDYEIDTTTLTLPAGTGMNRSAVATTVRSLDDPVDDDAETVVVAASRGGTEFASRTLTILDDDAGSTRVELSLNPAQVREDAAATAVRVKAELDEGARTQDTEVTVTVGSPGDSALEGTDYETVDALTLTIDAGKTEAETTFTLRPTNDNSAEGAEGITVDGSVSGLGVVAVTLTLNDDDVESTEVALTLDPDEVSESTGSRPVRITGTLNGGARPADTVLTVTVGTPSDTAVEGTDFADVGDLDLSIPANRTEASVTFTLRPTNDPTAEGDETITVSGEVAGLSVLPAEFLLRDDDDASTRVDLSLSPPSVSEGVASAQVRVTGRLNDGARPDETVVALTVGHPDDTAVVNSDYAGVFGPTLTIPPNETTAETTFTLFPEDDGIAEGAESITVSGQTGALTVNPATLTLSDNDTPSRRITLSVDPRSVREENVADVMVTGRLDAGARAEDTTVRLTVGAAGDTAEPGTDYGGVGDLDLTIGAGETEGSAAFQLVPVDNDAADGARTLSVTGTTVAAGLPIEPARGVMIALEDDDVPAVLVTPESLEVREAGSNDYQVVLQTQPTADVTVTISGATGDLSLDRPSLVFTPGDWETVQFVTVMAADDADNVQDADLTLTHRASGAAEYAGQTAELVVTILENDPSLLFRGTPVAVPEGGMATYEVSLATEPTGDVAVAIEGISGDLSLDSTDLLFMRGNWEIARTVTVTAADDEDGATDPAVTLTHSATGGGYDGIAGTVRVSVTEKDPVTNPGGGGGGGGAANRPPVVERVIPAQVLAAGDVLELDISLSFYDREQRALDYYVESANPAVATATASRDAVLTIRGISRGVTTITVTAADRRDERASQTFTVTVTGPALVPLFPSASDPLGRQGFVRVVNRSAEAGEVSITAHDDSKTVYDALTLAIGAGETVHFNSHDLETGNAAKGLTGGTGAGTGDWRLAMTSELEIEVLAYIRTEDGFLTTMHDIAPIRDGGHWVAVFNPGSNPNQVSSLRLVNPAEDDAVATIVGIDDAGRSPGTEVTLTVPAGASRTLTAAELETGGAGLDGALGDGTGKWRLLITCEEAIVVMSLLSSPTGHLTNLSTVPGRTEGVIVPAAARTPCAPSPRLPCPGPPAGHARPDSR